MGEGMKKGELTQIVFKWGEGSFRDAKITVRRGRNVLTKRIHRFANQNGYWQRYRHDGYPMQQIMRSQQQFKRYGLRLPNEIQNEACEC